MTVQTKVGAKATKLGAFPTVVWKMEILLFLKNKNVARSKSCGAMKHSSDMMRTKRKF